MEGRKTHRGRNVQMYARRMRGGRLCCTLFPLMLSKEIRIILLKGRGESVFGHAVLTVACVFEF